MNLKPYILSTALLVSLTSNTIAEAPAVKSDESKIDVSDPAAIKRALEQMTGKSVAVRLHTGDDLSGTVESVGPSAVRIAQLTGKEYFSAVVKIDDISAVIYRSK